MKGHAGNKKASESRLSLGKMIAGFGNKNPACIRRDGIL
jgi:hypothetical protein